MITESEMTAARQAWGDNLVRIAQTYDTDGIDKARGVAEDVLGELYGFELGPIMFKPTMASGEQTFRPSKKGALSYFVAHDADYPLDGGFALKGWRTVTTESSASFVEGDVAMWMGWMHFTDKDGQCATVDKSFGYKRDENGVLRIMLHHSSFPYQP